MAGSYDNQTRGGVDPKTGKGKASAFFFLSACAAEVEVDTETGKVTVEQIVSAVDAGKAVNPKQCDMQNEGSMIMSLGSALFEEMVFDNGQPINATFLEYMPPSMEDHPREFQSVIVETPHPEGPFGAKGVGEAALGPVEPAIGNAIANALNGLRIKDLPIRPDRILKAVQIHRIAERKWLSKRGKVWNEIRKRSRKERQGRKGTEETDCQLHDQGARNIRIEGKRIGKVFSIRRIFVV